MDKILAALEAYRKVLPVQNTPRSAYTPVLTPSDNGSREPFGRVLLTEMGKIRSSGGVLHDASDDLEGRNGEN